MIDVSGLVPEAQPIAARVAEIYLKHTSPWFIGLIAHGSAVKGGFIPGCSDIDFQLFLDDSAFSSQGHLPMTLGFTIRRELERVQLEPFRYVQCYPHSSKPLPGFIGPIPGAYHLLSGKLPVPEATTSQLRESAIDALNKLDSSPSFIIGKLLGHGGVRLARNIRLLCTKVWPVLYQVLTVRSDDPIAIWRLSKKRAIMELPERSDLAGLIQKFYQSIEDYYPDETSLEGAFSVIENGMSFLSTAKNWWEENNDLKGLEPPPDKNST